MLKTNSTLNPVSRKARALESLFSLSAYALFILALALAATQAFAAEDAGKKAGASAVPAEGEIDISDVQSQYWKAHDKEFEVIQNKLYSKAGRFEVCPLFGLYQRVDFQDTQTLGGSLAYSVNDAWGFEAMAYTMFTQDSRVVEKFKQTRGATIEFNSEKSYMGAHVQFSPIYGKFSFLGKKISHFDLYVSPGFGATKTASFRPTYSFALGQKFWVTNHINVRVEYRWYHYTDTIATSEGATAVKNGGPGFYQDGVNDQNLMFGVSYLF